MCWHVFGGEFAFMNLSRWYLLGQAIVEQHAKGVDIGPDARLPESELLGRSERARSKMRGILFGFGFQRSSNAEIDDGHPIVLDDDVGGLEVAMNDGRVKVLMQLADRIAELRKNVDSKLDGWVGAID